MNQKELQKNKVEILEMMNLFGKVYNALEFIPHLINSSLEETLFTVKELNKLLQDQSKKPLNSFPEFELALTTEYKKRRDERSQKNEEFLKRAVEIILKFEHEYDKDENDELNKIAGMVGTVGMMEVKKRVTEHHENIEKSAFEEE